MVTAKELSQDGVNKLKHLLESFHIYPRIDSAISTIDLELLLEQLILEGMNQVKLGFERELKDLAGGTAQCDRCVCEIPYPEEKFTCEECRTQEVAALRKAIQDIGDNAYVDMNDDYYSIDSPYEVGQKWIDQALILIEDKG